MIQCYRVRPELASHIMASGKGKNSTASRSRKRPTPSEGPKVIWDGDRLDTRRTDRLIDWLENNPSDRHKLFSDSTQDARAQGRRREVGKTHKSFYYAKIAQHVFQNDGNPQYRAEYAVNPQKYAKSVENRLVT